MKTGIMIQKESFKDLMELIKENPDLPIVPFVDSEVVADDGYCRWLGSWGSCGIIEYTSHEMHNSYPEMIYKDDTENLEDYLLCTTEMSEKEIEEYINNLNWTKAISVNIDLPN